MGSETVSQHPEGNVLHGQVYIDHGTAHKQAATDWVQTMSDSYDSLGPIYQKVKDQWHKDTKHRALAAHHSYGDYCINYGQTCVGTGQAFANTEQDNLNLVASISPEGTAGIPTSDGTPA